MAEDKSAEILANNKAILQFLKDQSRQQAINKGLAEDAAEAAKEQADALSDIDKANNNLVKTLSKVETQLNDQYKIEKSLLDELKNQVAAKRESLLIGGKNLAQANAELKNEIKLIAAQENLAKYSDREIASRKGLIDLLGKSVDELDNFIDRYIPMGKALSKFIGLNRIKANLLKAHNIAITSFNHHLAHGATLQEAATTAMKRFMKVANLGPVVMLAMVAAVAGLVTLAASMEKQFAAVAKETGITVAQSEALVLSSQEVANQLDNQLLSLKDVLAVQKATIKEFGTMAMITPEIAAEVANIGEAFGYGAEEAAKVNNVLLGLGVPAAEAADAQRELAAEALKAGVNVATVTADIATNAKATAKYFNGNVKSLTKAAVEAAKMGVSLATMVKVSDSLLDIESSLANQFEFMALTGKEVNFDLARQLALQGDIAGATKLILDQMGGINEFNQMDVLQKEAAAKAAGMSVDDLSKSLAIQDKLGNATEEQLAAAMGLGLSAAEIADMSDKELQNRLEQEQTAARLGKESSQFANELKMILLPLGRDLLKIFEAVIPVIKIIASTVGTIISPLLYIIESFTKVLGLLTGSNEQLTTMEKIVGSLVGGLLLYKGVMKGIAAFKALGLLFTKKENAETKKGLAARMLEFGIEKGKAILAGISAAFKSVGWMPVVGVALATAAVGALVALVSSKASPAGDMFSPADGRTQISTKEGGLFQLSKNDDVMAAPGLSGAMAGGGTATSGGSTDMSTTNALLNQLVSNISALSNRPVQIKIGDRVVDEIKAQVDINSTYVVG